MGDKIKNKINPNFTDGKTFRGEPLEILDLQYKADADIDHLAKFRGDRPTELGDPAVANLKKTFCCNA